jgi:hypothetical protein
MYILFKKWPLVTLVYVSECFQINLESWANLGHDMVENYNGITTNKKI